MRIALHDYVHVNHLEWNAAIVYLGPTHAVKKKAYKKTLFGKEGGTVNIVFEN